MGLEKRGEIWYFTKRINGQRFRESTGFADRKSAERRAVRDRARHPRRHRRLEEHDSELRGMVGRVPQDVHAAEDGQEP